MTRALRALVACAVLVAACGDDDAGSDAGLDLAVSTDLSTEADLDAPIPCATDGDCPSNTLRCAYALAEGCAATKGICLPRQGPPFCGARKVLCGCDGITKNGDGDCFYDKGYASGPSTGEAHAGSCGPDGGI